MREVATEGHSQGGDIEPTVGSGEQEALRISAVGNVFFAALGLAFGWKTGSEAILLDGYFSLVSFGMALLTLRIAKLVAEPEDRRFHFGYFGFEPLVNVFKGLLILGVCALAFASAVNSVLHGGRAISVGTAVIYSVIATVGALTMTGLQTRAAKRTGSSLLAVDAANWRIDAIMSLVVTVAFLLTLWLSTSAWADAVPYVDPGLVILLILAVVVTPIRIIVDGLGELVHAAPAVEEQRKVRAQFDEAVASWAFRRVHLRMMRLGRASYLLAHVVVAPEFTVDGVEGLDEIRRKISKAMAELDPPWVVDIVFVADESLVED